MSALWMGFSFSSDQEYFGNGTPSCDYGSNLTDSANKAVPATLVSSVLSIFGSLLIILTFILWKDVRRSTARRILLFLAIADFFTAVGYLFSSSVALAKTYQNSTWIGICKFEGFWNTYFPVVSFFWTTYLAVYFFVALVLKKPYWSGKLMIPFHLTAWLIPLVICTTFLSLGWLGTDKSLVNNNNATNESEFSQVSGSWCFVSPIFYQNQSSELKFKQGVIEYLIIEGVSGKFWEIISYVVVIVCYTVIVCHDRCTCFTKEPAIQVKDPDRSIEASSYYTKQRISDAMAWVDIKLMLVPIVFVFLRMWGTIRYFLFMTPSCTQHFIQHKDKSYWLCTTKDCFNLAYSEPLVILQSLCDPLQGFGNAVLFVFLSRVIVHRLLSCVTGIARRCLYCITYPYRPKKECPPIPDEDDVLISSTNCQQQQDDYEEKIYCSDSYKQYGTIQDPSLKK